MTMEDFLGTAPDDQEEELRKKNGLYFGRNGDVLGPDTAEFSGGSLGRLSQVPAAPSFDFTKVGFSPAEAASMQEAKLRGLSPATRLDNWNAASSYQPSTENLLYQPKPLHTGFLSNFFNQDEMETLSKLNDRLATNATGTALNMIFKPDEMADLRNLNDKLANNTAGTIAHMMFTPSERQDILDFGDRLVNALQPSSSKVATAASASPPTEFGPSLPSIYGMASQASGPDRMIMPLESGGFSTTQSPVGRITTPSGMILDSGDPRTINAGGLTPPGWFDNPENRLTAAVGLPTAAQMMFHADTARQMEQMKAENELAKARILSENKDTGFWNLLEKTPPAQRGSLIANAEAKGRINKETAGQAHLENLIGQATDTAKSQNQPPKPTSDAFLSTIASQFDPNKIDKLDLLKRLQMLDPNFTPTKANEMAFGLLPSSYAQLMPDRSITGYIANKIFGITPEDTTQAINDYVEARMPEQDRKKFRLLESFLSTPVH